MFPKFFDNELKNYSIVKNEYLLWLTEVMIQMNKVAEENRLWIPVMDFDEEFWLMMELEYDDELDVFD